MEDCIHAKPKAFLGRDLEIVARQPRIRGFVPDLVLKDNSDRLIILEIQQNALDRYHVYKSLEYRDLFAEKEKCSPPDIVLFCESMDDRFRPLMKTHGIDLIQMDRGEFIRTAIKHTPDIVANSLSNTPKELFYNSRTKSDKPNKIEFLPFDWGYRTQPSDALAHLYREFGRLQIDVSDLPRKYYHTLYWDVCNFLDKELEDVIKALWNPSAWKHDLLKERRSQERHTCPYEQISKPRIEIYPYITQKGNLSVTWVPARAGFSDCEWSWWPSGGRYGWSRPNNELLFLREVHYLNPGIHFSKWDDRVNYDVLDGLFIALIKTCFDHLVNVLRAAFEVELINDIELDTVDAVRSGNDTFGRRHIVGWRIFSLESRRRRDSDAWIANFSNEYGFTLERFCSEFRLASFENNKISNLERYISNKLKKDGYAITDSKVREIRARIVKHHDSQVRDLIP